MVPKTGIKKSVWPLGLLGSLSIAALAIMLIPVGGAIATIGPEDVVEHVGLRTGDVFEYELDMTGMIDSIIAESGSSSVTTKDISSSYKETVDRSEKIHVDGSDIDAHLVIKDMRMEFTIVDTEQQVESKVSIYRISNEWISKMTYRPVKVEGKEHSIMSFVQGEGMFKSTSSIETETDSQIAYSIVNGTSAYPMKAGNVWTTTEIYTLRTMEKSRYKYESDPFSDWETISSEEEVTEDIEYTVMSKEMVSTPAGSFDAFKLSIKNVSGPQREIAFIDTFGMVVRMDRFELDEPRLVMTLKTYKFQNALDTDKDGSVNVKDAFPADASASVDSDGDGYPDAWNAGRTASDSTSGLKIDKYPQDPSKWSDPKDSPAGVLIPIVCMVLATLFVAVKRGRFS
jgi:hypothetical protein